MEMNHYVQPRFIAPMLCTRAPVLPHQHPSLASRFGDRVPDVNHVRGTED